MNNLIKEIEIRQLQDQNDCGLWDIHEKAAKAHQDRGDLLEVFKAIVDFADDMDHAYRCQVYDCDCVKSELQALLNGDTP